MSHNTITRVSVNTTSAPSAEILHRLSGVVSVLFDAAAVAARRYELAIFATFRLINDRISEAVQDRTMVAVDH